MPSTTLPNDPSVPTSGSQRRKKIIVEPGQDAKQAVFAVALLLLLSAVMFFIGLGKLPLIGPDEPRYAEVAREMFSTRDFVSPKLCGCPWFEKPALLYWMAAGSFRVFGVSEFSARLPCALLAGAVVFFLYFAVRRVSRASTAFFVCLVLATSPMFVGYARAAVTDMPLTATLAIALISVYLSTYSRGKARLGYWLLAWASAGLAVLAKGLVGIVLFVTIAGITWLFIRRPGYVRWWHLVLGASTFLALAATWYFPIIDRYGEAFIREFFINHHFKRYLTNEYHHPEPFYFFPAIALGGIAPLTFYLVPAIAGLGKLRRREESEALRHLRILAWVWFVAPVLFFSFSESKLPGYILPAFPALAIIVGLELDALWRGHQSRTLTLGSGLTALTLVAIGVAFAVYTARESSGLSSAAKLIYLAPLALGLAAVASLAASRVRPFLVCCASFAPTITVAGLLVLIPVLAPTLSFKELSLQVGRSLGSSEKIAFFVDRQYAPVFYTQGRVLCGGKGSDVLNAMSTDELVEALSARHTLIVITNSKWVKSLLADKRYAAELIGQQRDELAFRLIPAPQPGSL
ncbi:MAG TPA: glycosyltransferase family 39 protein [Blastocatellia bacterium]|nr:glycosyltransferase family 39 protein [Blastocatellia bacterium]